MFVALRCVLRAAFPVVLLIAQAQAEGVELPAPRATGVDEGEILLGELNCLACHSAPEAISRRINSRGAPKLGTDGLRLTPHWLRDWLSDPGKIKPGTLMPHAFHGLTPAQRSETAEELTQFLVSIQPAGPAAGVSADASRVEKGGRLFNTVGCVACHAPTERGDVSPKVFAAAQTNAVPMGDLARKYPAAELVRFLREPVVFRPGGRMPALGLSETEATDLATFLLRDQLTAASNSLAAPVAGLKWQYYEGDFTRCAELESATSTASGVTDELTGKLAKRDGNFGLRFTGLLEIPTDGEYEFSTTSDDGSQLFVSGNLVVDNDGEHGTATKRGKITLSRGPVPFEVRFFQRAGGFEFAVQWAGPGFVRGPIPASALKHEARPMLPVGQSNFALDPTKVAAGREWFAKLNCAACHSGTDIPVRSARPLLELTSASAGGCLADAVPASAPRYDISPPQRQALRKTVAAANQLAGPIPPSTLVELTLTRLNCYACHSRDGVGGPAASGRTDWFRMTTEADLGDEGRIPPLLTGVGAKLKPAWLTEVLERGTKVRPYMATRMPQFGTVQAKALQPALLAADRPASPQPEPASTDRAIKLGWKLVGRDGLSCIACHTFTTYGSAGIPALGLDTMYQRLEWDWFRRYLPDPAALRPGTRMPTFWPEGHAANRDILGGDTQAQIQAIWAYLAGGAKAEVPAGLVRGRKELVAETEPVIYRNFIEGAGARAIGVGYPEHANLAFDAENLRLALLWQGSFIDASRHSTDRGVGFEPPLGDHRIALPGGPAFAVLGSPEAPWPKATDQRFLGYRLDAGRRPTFQYSVGPVAVTEAILPRPGEVDMTVVRNFTFAGKSSGALWFRAAVGKVEQQPNGTFRVDDKLSLRFPGGGEPKIVGSELRVPISVPGNLTVEMTW
ncbi:MAG TPA: c-type cytochrome [Verrucomicrobiota bacterium]|nr:c-type cytochrome [Verrucomicrobiota bacterium]